MTGATTVTAQSTENLSADAQVETRKRRAIYRANYRGTKEMDWLLGKYGIAHVPKMSEAELTRFELLLALPDPQLQGWLMAGDVPHDHDLRDLILAIRAYHRA